jgi:hypothetical protein
MFQPQELRNVQKDGTAIMNGELQVILSLYTSWRRSGGLAPRILKLGSR